MIRFTELLYKKVLFSSFDFFFLGTCVEVDSQCIKKTHTLNKSDFLFFHNFISFLIKEPKEVIGEICY